MLTLITGGCRSGKSGFALDLVDRLGGEKIYLATCPKSDDEEMMTRIQRHQKEREHLGAWRTLEEQTDLVSIIKDHEDEHLLIDCMTLWVSNLMYAASQSESSLTEQGVEKLTMDLIDACQHRSKHTVLVTNETGMGIVPENALARQFRDLIGRCNQVIGRHCDRLIFMVSGQPWALKGSL
jgi:adenosylcobinamide kinase/adenosylcobinamide-phosphate guanylyltransferase